MAPQPKPAATGAASGGLPTHSLDPNAFDLAHEFRTAGMVWKRELIRFFRNRSRIVSGLIQPLLFLFVLGFGLSQLVGSSGNVTFTQFLFPGIVAMSIVTTAIFSAISIVWDREFGFLREMLVAPASRVSIVLGKTAGGATVAASQGAIMLILAPVIGVSLTPLIVVEVLIISLFMAFMLTAFGVFVASRMKEMQGFQVVMQFLLFPMIFLGGTMFPVVGLPWWLEYLTRVDPVTYPVDALRRTIFSNQTLPAVFVARYGNGVEINGTILAIWQELAIVFVLAVIFTLLAMQGFSKKE
ncbi:MAG: ABC transporter permease [Thermoplasmatota archaeon]